MTERPTTIAEIAADFTALLKTDQFCAAGEKYWSDDEVIRSFRTVASQSATYSFTGEKS